jgi:hypothetical protein
MQIRFVGCLVTVGCLNAPPLLPREPLLELKLLEIEVLVGTIPKRIVLDVLDSGIASGLAA